MRFSPVRYSFSAFVQPHDHGFSSPFGAASIPNQDEDGIAVGDPSTQPVTPMADGDEAEGNAAKGEQGAFIPDQTQA